MEKLIGRRFGKRIVISIDNKSSPKHPSVICRCDCGKESKVLVYALLHNLSHACASCRNVYRDHGMTNTPLFAAWMNMRSRCNNPNMHDYKYYGGRGIYVCTEWKDFINFKNWAYQNGYNESLEIDRIDNNGDYSPGNCRFVSHAINCKNRSMSRRWVVNGQPFETCIDAAKSLSVCPATILNWCLGNKQFGTPPREGCHAEKLY